MAAPLCITIVSLFVLIPLASAVACLNSCGGLPVAYPFGTGRGCGNTVFERYVNCTKGQLQLFTPTGQYIVKSIDYSNRVLIIHDPRMSTCSRMQTSSSFGVPVDAPFSLVDTTIVLLDCSSTSSGYDALSPLCDPAGAGICESLYNCPTISQLGLSLSRSTSTCCVYSAAQLTTSPYEINLPLLQCSSYTSIYSFGAPYTYGSDGSADNYKDASSWAYGIALKYYSDETSAYAKCKLCQGTDGACAFNDYGFVCICSAGVNTTTQCFGSSVNKGINHLPQLYFRGLIMVGSFLSFLL